MLSAYLSLTPPIAAGIGVVIADAAIIPLARLIPQRMEQRWQKEAHAIAGGTPKPVDATRYDIGTRPRMVIEVTAALLMFIVSAQLGFTVQGLAYAVYFLGLVLLFAINQTHRLLPDRIVLAILWLGLLYRAWNGTAADGIYGAACALLAPTLLMSLLQAASGKQYFGGGDVKTFAMAGAWFGLRPLPVLFGIFVAVLLAEAVLSAVRRGRAPLPSGMFHLVASVGAFLQVHSA